MNGNILLIPLYALVIWMRNTLFYTVPVYVQFCSASLNEHKYLRGSNSFSLFTINHFKLHRNHNLQLTPSRMRRLVN